MCTDCFFLYYFLLFFYKKFTMKIARLLLTVILSIYFCFNIRSRTAGYWCLFLIFSECYVSKRVNRFSSCLQFRPELAHFVFDSSDCSAASHDWTYLRDKRNSRKFLAHKQWSMTYVQARCCIVQTTATSNSQRKSTILQPIRSCADAVTASVLIFFQFVLTHLQANSRKCWKSLWSASRHYSF